MLRCALVGSLALGSCAPSHSPHANETREGPAAPKASVKPAGPEAEAESSISPVTPESKSDHPAAEGGKPILATNGEWDDEPGEEAIVLHDDGKLVAGTDEGTATLPTSSGYFFDEQAKISVVRLGDATFPKALLLAIPTADQEDPPNVYQVFVSEGGKLRKVYEEAIGSYGVVPLEFPGDGSARYLEDGWTACERAGFPENRSKGVVRQHVILRVGPDKTLVEAKRKPSKHEQRCDELAACPFVYVLTDRGPMLQGEILRNLRGAAARRPQTLTLRPAPSGRLRLRIAEEKLEVTRVDAVALHVDGEQLPPVECESLPQPPYCEADGRDTVLRTGDTLDLTFDVPADATSISAWALGHYAVPRAHAD